MYDIALTETAGFKCPPEIEAVTPIEIDTASNHMQLTCHSPSKISKYCYQKVSRYMYIYMCMCMCMCTCV